MGPPRRFSLLRRLAVPLLSAVLLVGAGAAFVLVPEKVHGEPCHGNALSIPLREEQPFRHSQECHAKALTDLIFGSSVAGSGLVLAVVSVLLLKRPAPGLSA